MKTDKKPSIFNDRTDFGSTDELDEYGVWVKSEPEDFEEGEAFNTFSEDFSMEDDGNEPALDSESEAQTDFAGESSDFDLDLPDDGDFQESSAGEAGDFDLDLPDDGGFQESSAAETGEAGDFDLDLPDDGGFQESSAAETSEAGDFDPNIDSDEKAAVDDTDFENFEATEETPEAPEEAQNNSSISNELLKQIANELSAIKTELSILKKEFSEISKDANRPLEHKPDNADKSSTKTQPAPLSTIFDDDDQDDKITLTGDELANISSNVEFETAPAEDTLVENPNGAVVEPSESDGITDEGIDFPTEEITLSTNEIDTPDDGLDFSEELANFRKEEINLSEVAAALQNEGIELSTVDEIDLSGEGSDPANDGIDITEGEIEIPEPPEEDGGRLSPTELNAVLNNSSETNSDVTEENAQVDSDFSIDNSPVSETPVEEVSVDIDLADDLDLDTEIPQDTSVEPEPDLEIDAVDTIDTVSTVDENAGLGSTDEIEDDQEIEIDKVDIDENLDFDDLVADTLKLPPETAGQSDIDLSVFNEPKKPEISAPASKANDKNDETVSPRFKQDVQTVLAYMDQLLEALPEEKIEEFARSEQFEIYKKVFKELGLV